MTRISIYKEIENAKNETRIFAHKKIGGAEKRKSNPEKIESPQEGGGAGFKQKTTDQWDAVAAVRRTLNIQTSKCKRERETMREERGTESWKRNQAAPR